MPREFEARAAATRLAGSHPEILRQILEAERPGPRIAATVPAVAPEPDADPIEEYAKVKGCSYSEAAELMGG